jgi:hypothetical protein
MRLCFVFAALALPTPATATEIIGDEALVMRLAFEDCLGFVRDDTAPFVGLSMAEASAEARKAVPARMLETGSVAQLLSPRYVAAWGESETDSYCAIYTVWSEPFFGTGLLGVTPTTIIDTITARAEAEGLTDRDPGMIFSPVQSTRWAEPDKGDRRGVVLVVMPTDEDAESGLMDAGLILVGGPPAD